MSVTEQSVEQAALYGRDETAGIIDCHLVGDQPRATIRVYQRRKETHELQTQDEPLYPFFFCSDITHLKGFPRSNFRFKELAGTNYYRFLVVFDRWSTHWDAYQHIKNNLPADEPVGDTVYLIPSPTQQYLMQTGRTLFKDHTLNDIHRLQLDIEVESSGSFPNADRASDQIIIVALSDNRGWEHVIDAQHQSEADLLGELVTTIRERDPDVIEGHNIFAFDLAYIMSRCKRHGVSFAIGRDGSTPRTFDSSMRFAERTVDFPAVDIAGRHVIDTYFQVLSYDVFKRDMPGYSLKKAARYFGLDVDNRTYVEGDQISNVWRDAPDRLIEYALDDVRETGRLAQHLSGSTFYLTQLLPMSYEQVARSGPAAKIESLFVREYLHQKHSLPRSEWGSQSTGGYTDLFITGVVGPIVYADVDSLYPSIMLEYSVQPEGDELNLFPALLDKLTSMRLQTKQQMNDASDEEVQSELDARQSSYKILINSFYGMLGFGMALFNDFSEADRVASTGQKLLRRIIRLIQELDGTVVEVDTDGVLFIPPSDVQGHDAEQEFLDELNERMPEGIHISMDGRYARMLSYKKKNYALLTYKDEVKYKGSSLISRSNEPFGRTFVRKAVRLLLEEEIEALHQLYIRTRERIKNHNWSVEDFARTETLKDTLEDYLNDVESGKRPRSALYELALRRTRETDRTYRKGDRISYYITGSSANVTTFKNARFADEWNPEDPDENTGYYLKRLDQFTRKFEPFFRDHDFRLVFSPEDLFGFSAEGIALQTRRLKGELDADWQGEVDVDKVPF